MPCSVLIFAYTVRVFLIMHVMIFYAKIDFSV